MVAMPAYLIADVNIHDPALYEEYKKLTPPTVAAYGGRFIARGGTADTLEGEWPATRIVIVEFPSREHAKRWLESPEYSVARKMRNRAATARILVVDGITAGL